MPGTPKRRYTKSRQGMRRSHQALVAPTIGECPQCHSPKLPHHACPTCGTYAGREVIKIKEAKKKGS
jgi:large subunit ribosomal protein L32